MQFKSLISWLLTIIIILSLLLALVGCRGSDPSSEGTTKAETSGTSLPVEKANYGKTFTVLYPGAWNSGPYEEYFFAEELEGNDMRMAIYERGRMVEEHLGVELKAYSSGDIDTIAPALRKSVQAQDDDYQMVLTHCFIGVVEMAMEDLIYDLKELPMVNLDAPYWNQSIMESMKINDKYYYAVNDFMISLPTAIFFNKQMALDNKMEDFYQLVRDGRWTLDKLMEFSAQAYRDEGDKIYGFAGMSNWPMISFMSASDIKAVSHNNEGKLELTINSDRMHTLIEKLVNFSQSQSTYFYPYPPNPSTQMLISSNRCLFSLESLHTAIIHRDSDVDIGFLPLPKFDEAQKDYYSLEWSGFLGVPITIQDPEMVGSVIEMLAYYSATTTIPAYYERLLGTRLANQPQDAEMLGVIFSNIVVDPALNFMRNSGSALGRLAYSIPALITTSSNQFASWYAQHSSAAQQLLDEIN